MEKNYNLEELRKYIPPTTQSFTDEEDETWDARRLVKEYLRVHHYRHGEKGYNDAPWSYKIRLERTASAIRAFSGHEPTKCPNDIIEMLFDDSGVGFILGKSPVCFSDYRRIRNLIDLIMPNDSKIKYIFYRRSWHSKTILRERCEMIKCLINYRVQTYDLKNSHSGILCCPPSYEIAASVCENLYNPFLNYCDNIIDEIIVLLLGKSFKKTIRTKELKEKYDYPDYTEAELRNWEYDNW